MVKQCAYGTFRSDTEIRGMRGFPPHFQSLKHRRKGAGGELNSVGDPTPNSIYRKTHICLLQSKWSCLQIAIYLANYAIARYDNSLSSRENIPKQYRFMSTCIITTTRT